MAKSELMKKILKESDNPYISTLEESEFLNREDPIVTDIPALNVILSGKVDGGFDSGIVSIAGKSKHFKTLFALYMAKAFLEKHREDDGVLVFFDSEFGSPRSYFDFFGDLKEKVIHAPVTTVEDLREQMTKFLEGFDRTDNVMFIVDSIGNLASNKETEDTLDGKTTVDMTRAKMLKSMFRLVTPRLTMKNIPLVTINHTYQTLEMFSKEVQGGGTGNIYASDTIIFVGKQQEKEGKELVGWNFVLKSEKSRYVREQVKIPVQVMYKGGIYKYSGMFDLALSYDIITSPSKGYYEYGDIGKKMRRKEIEQNSEIMEEIITDDKFKQLVESEFML